MNKKIAIVTSCAEAWGGSEELWAKGIPHLMACGCEVGVFKPDLPFENPGFKKLHAIGVHLTSVRSSEPLVKRFLKKLASVWGYRMGRNTELPGFVQVPVINYLTNSLRRFNPDLVIISQGINFDGLGYAYACMEAGYPYVVVAQKAVDFYWPLPDDRRLMKEILKNARRCYFVSQHNKRLTEEQFAIRLVNSEVIFNPIKIRESISYPAVDAGFRLCCVARLFVLDKGQDMLIRILSQEKWKERPLHVTFVGKGVDEEALRELAAFLQVSNVSFVGQLTEIDRLWENCHALVLPSRSEGLPLTIMEAMMAGRTVITTTAGGNTELLEDGITGFFGNPDEYAFESAMERAWQNRHRWESIGAEAHLKITACAPKSPELAFANNILQLI